MCYWLSTGVDAKSKSIVKQSVCTQMIPNKTTDKLEIMNQGAGYNDRIKKQTPIQLTR